MQPPSWASVSRETWSQLAAYAELLGKWNRKINLVSPQTIDALWSRHIWDSYQLLDLIPPNTPALADIGSGGGLPGLILAIGRPRMAVTLIERDQRKCAFLTHAALSLGLRHVTVANKDIREMTQPYPVITARALASLDVLCELVAPLLLKDTICLFPKGESFAKEVEEAKTRWAFTHTVTPSKTHDAACIVSVSELKTLG